MVFGALFSEGRSCKLHLALTIPRSTAAVISRALGEDDVRAIGVSVVGTAAPLDAWAPVDKELISPEELKQALRLEWREGPAQDDWRFAGEVDVPLDQKALKAAGSQAALAFRFVAFSLNHPSKIFAEASAAAHSLDLKWLGEGEFLCAAEFLAPENNVLTSSAFCQVIFGRDACQELRPADLATSNVAGGKDSVLLHLVVIAPRIPASNTKLVACGNVDELGNSELSRAPVLHRKDRKVPRYEATVRVSRAAVTDVQFRFFFVDAENAAHALLKESGEERRLEELYSPALLKASLERTSDGLLQLSYSGVFRYASTWKGAGVAVPVSSLRSDASAGIGEFLDIIDLVEWSSSCGLRLIQLLPIYDTGFDPSPYAACSVFALHPVYMRLTAVADSIGLPAEHDVRKEIMQAQSELNAFASVEYQRTLRWKLRLIELLYQADNNQTLSTPEFHAFFEANKDWLPVYALWKGLRDRTGEWNYKLWPASAKQAKDLAKVENKEYGAKIGLVFFTQYYLHVQMQAASECARRCGVVLKGDLPIGVARFGADTWTHPDLFRMDMSAGCPSMGDWSDAQNWDFPLYNWEEMARKKFAWWKRRMEMMSQYFTACRVDHVLGFFRIWAIPSHNWTGFQGHFDPCNALKLDELKELRAVDNSKAVLERLLQPYVTFREVEAAFGEQANRVVSEVFTARSGGAMLDFRPECDTVEKIGVLYDPSEPELSDSERAFREHARKVLWKLQDNRMALCFEKQYYLTCHMLFTSSFKDLHDDPGDPVNGVINKAKLSDLWHDFYNKRQSWRGPGLVRLSMIQKASSMMICAEDLGSVPDEVYPVLDQLGILGLRIQRWPPGGGNFLRSDQYPYLSVAATSCHDCSTLRAWWEHDDRLSAQKLYSEHLNHDLAPETCTDVASQLVVASNFRSDAMWAIIPIQDLMDMWDELRSPDPRMDAINRPGTVEGCWAYRMKWSLSDLKGKSSFNSFLLNQLQDCGRLDV
ncbi:4-alpha-glucanotransferase DPE2 [Porphyridium purpureum]|uniref:4-alpha-glucanotransferase n=1 Tax=Porphyridium purpureum TaxID=35688 RepID=A0A5J4Z4E2_PORPP|nr:4-alpha-glucanotransferase DPE2 [Porphyridium purpureum]|eukprot:POR1185..scf295_1